MSNNEGDWKSLELLQDCSSEEASRFGSIMKANPDERAQRGGSLKVVFMFAWDLPSRASHKRMLHVPKGPCTGHIFP